VLGVGCVAGAEHRVTDSDAGDAVADLVNDTGGVEAHAGRLGRTGSLGHAAGADLPVDAVDAGGPDRDPDLPGTGVRFGDVDELQDVGIAVRAESHCPHGR
jgi:hypothetical protein